MKVNEGKGGVRVWRGKIPGKAATTGWSDGAFTNPRAIEAIEVIEIVVRCQGTMGLAKWAVVTPTFIEPTEKSWVQWGTRSHQKAAGCRTKANWKSFTLSHKRPPALSSRKRGGGRCSLVKGPGCQSGHRRIGRRTLSWDLRGQRGKAGAFVTTGEVREERGREYISWGVWVSISLQSSGFEKQGINGCLGYTEGGKKHILACDEPAWLPHTTHKPMGEMGRDNPPLSLKKTWWGSVAKI